jgi:hypothetical protein
MVKSLGGNITTNLLEDGDANDKAAKISALVPKDRHLYAMPSLARRELSKGRYRAGFLLIAVGHVVAICCPTVSYRFASRMFGFRGVATGVGRPEGGTAPRDLQ